MTRLFSMLLAVASLVLMASPQRASAQSQHVLLTACNDTSAYIWVAVGEVLDPLEDWPSTGWWKIAGGNCMYVGSYPTNGDGFNIYAQAADGTNWSGSQGHDDYYCVDINNAFTLDDGWRANAYDDCPTGYTLKRFRFVASPSGYGDDENFSYTYHFHT